MSVIESITVEGFKSIASVQDLELRPINVMIGPNGSGKSNFIGVFSFLQAIRSGRLKDYVNRAGGADRILHFGSRTTEEMAICGVYDNGEFEYHLTLAATESEALFPRKEVIFKVFHFLGGAWKGVTFSSVDGEAQISDNHFRGASTIVMPLRGQRTPPLELEDTLCKIRGYLDSWRIFHLHDTSSGSPMRKTADVNDNRYLRADASNLAAFLYFLRAKHESEFNLIRRTVQLVAPYFDDFLLQPLALNEDRIRLEWRHKGTDAYFDVSSFSDGTLRFIALTTLLLQPKSLRPSVIIIDEPELGLHPYAITLFAMLVKQASATTQVILATQSPILLDHFQPEDVLVVDRVEGRTQFKRLDADSLDFWLKDYSLGQLWEKNELGGRPARE